MMANLNLSEFALHENNELDYLVLSTDQIRQVNQFRQDLSLCQNDQERYILCKQIRNQILDLHTRIELLTTALDQVMHVECLEYQRQREKIQQRKRSDQKNEAEWRRFLGLAAVGSKSMVPLKTVCCIWGRDKVQHYQWAYMGENFCNKLCAAAREVDSWDEAMTKLNALICR